jgi:hypothetical protein
LTSAARCAWYSVGQPYSACANAAKMVVAMVTISSSNLMLVAVADVQTSSIRVHSLVAFTDVLLIVVGPAVSMARSTSATSDPPARRT